MAMKLNFEAGMQELEALVLDLESGRMTLEESFAAYEKASKLRLALQKLLDEGDQKIRLLVGNGEEVLDVEEIQ